MKNKYYTPELHEFHIGFEFEEKIVDDLWKSSKFLYRWFEERYFLKQIDNKNIRVKHLDREDIESLGWEFKKDDLGFWDFCKGNNRLQFFPEKEKNISIFLNSYTIKNKSELKKLMQMLNIE